jgi:hypothetical protein
MSFIFDRLPGNSGIIPRRITCHLTSHGTVVAGTTYTIDMSFAHTTTNGVAVASAAAVDAAEEGEIWVLALGAGVIGDTVEFLIQGYYPTALITATDTVAAGPVASDANGALIAATTGDVIIGITPAVETDTTAGVWFCGTGIAAPHAI